MAASPPASPPISSVPKAALYLFSHSIWSSVVRLALEEKGYGHDEIDQKFVDLLKGENFLPTYLRINPKGTVPTLVVPFEKTLSADVESRFKALTDSISIVQFLDKSRTVISRTHTTSAAPAPALAPATIAFSAVSKRIIELLHADDVSSYVLTFETAKDEASLKVLAKVLLPMLRARRETLDSLLSEAEKGTVHASEKTKLFWLEKKVQDGPILSVFEDAEKAESELDTEGKEKRRAYFEKAKKLWEVDLKELLVVVSKEMIGPFVLGDQISIADLHLAAYLTRVISLAGGAASDVGNVAVSKLEAQVGVKFPKDFKGGETQRPGGAEVAQAGPQSKLAAFWDAVKERPSWKKVYAEGLP
ncbi:hypothetical protein JAAARDRAFT_29594 [Jaapia argillacea MUCL 33604]|uniref:GST N-terminal domain-containing protein n=1 Tax=Jaapia argillacea MUCL 33604 TaxID=933084 RepID=A0A067Q945_9AGAM|nr:hypothetical protein JAAARDRAFT_29594 [Jaapia argillacea MUCL 33604]